MGLAGNIVQFVQFVAALLNDTHKIHASVSGTTKKNEHLKGICNTLVSFTTRLEHTQSLPSWSSANGYSIGGKFPDNHAVITECAAACQEDC